MLVVQGHIWPPAEDSRPEDEILSNLREVESYFDDRADTIDDAGRIPNTEMTNLRYVRAAIAEIERLRGVR